MRTVSSDCSRPVSLQTSRLCHAVARQVTTEPAPGRRLVQAYQPPASIQEAEQQGRYSPSLESAFRIARVFGVGIEDVFGWDAGRRDR